MITGREPNIIRCMDPAQRELALADERKAIARREKMEQRLFSSWLKLQRGHGHLWFINPQANKASTIEPGHPDYTIFLKRGRVVLIEMKVEGGKLSPEQEQATLVLETLDHPVHICWSHVGAINVVQLYMSVDQPSAKTANFLMEKENQ